LLVAAQLGSQFDSSRHSCTNISRFRRLRDQMANASRPPAPRSTRI
jgi:hypothetical protein